jgi:hypothetical protein
MMQLLTFNAIEASFLSIDGSLLELFDNLPWVIDGSWLT